MMFRAVVFILLAVSAMPAVSQVVAPPIISSSNTANYRIAPTRVAFQVRGRFEHDSFQKSSEEALLFPAALNKALETLKLEPVSTQANAPHIGDISYPLMTTMTEVVFALPILSDPLERAAGFARLCDDMLKAAATVNGEVSGPRLFVNEKKRHEHNAVQQATESALIHAQSVADLMETDIYEVEAVRIVTVEWVESSGNRETAPTLDGISCVVESVVSYRHQP